MVDLTLLWASNRALRTDEDGGNTGAAKLVECDQPVDGEKIREI